MNRGFKSRRDRLYRQLDEFHEVVFISFICHYPVILYMVIKASAAKMPDIAAELTPYPG